MLHDHNLDVLVGQCLPCWGICLLLYAVAAAYEVQRESIGEGTCQEQGPL